MIFLYVRISASLTSMRAPAVAATVAQQSLTRGFESCCSALPASSLDAWHLRPCKWQSWSAVSSVSILGCYTTQAYSKAIHGELLLSGNTHLPPPGLSP